LCFVQIVYGVKIRDKKVVGVFVRFRAPFTYLNRRTKEKNWAKVNVAIQELKEHFEILLRVEK
jgi:hypothetical protein